MRGAALLLSSTARQLSARALPSMPAAVAALVTESIARANSELHDLARDLVREAGALYSRATWAELGGAESGWLVPGLHRLGFAPSGSVEDVAAVSEARANESERWSVELLDRMQEPMVDPTEESVEDLLAHASLEEIDGNPLGDLSLAAGSAPDLYEVELGPDEGRAVSGSGGGAVGAALNEAHSTPTGAGILGCIVVGAGLAGSAGETG